MASARKYWSVEQLTIDAEHHERREQYCRSRSIASSFKAGHDFWLGKQCAAREKAKASRWELHRRQHVDAHV